MADYCRNCNSELFAGQRFCRACGASTDPLSDEQAPTRMMNPQPDDWGARGAATAPASRPDTNPVYTPPGGYQPSVPPMSAQVLPPYVPPSKRSPWGWIIAAIGMGLFVALVIAVMMIVRFGRQSFNARTGSVTRVGENTFNETTTDQIVPAGNETAFIKTFPLDGNAAFSLRNVNGSIVISAWDQPTAEVKAFQKGADRTAPVVFSGDRRNVSIRTADKRNGQDIRYEIKLPREVGSVAINSVNGAINISGVSGKLVVEAVNGKIELTGVTGVSRVKTVNGAIKASLEKASDGPMAFETVGGSIDVILDPDFDATLDARTVQGSVNIDDQLGITVEKQVVGQRVRGDIGAGGQPLKLTTVNGSIKLAKR